MSAQMKDVVANWVSFEADEFKNDKTMVKKLPDDLKQRILRYLKELLENSIYHLYIYL